MSRFSPLILPGILIIGWLTMQGLPLIPNGPAGLRTVVTLYGWPKTAFARMPIPDEYGSTYAGYRWFWSGLFTNVFFFVVSTAITLYWSRSPGFVQTRAVTVLEGLAILSATACCIFYYNCSANLLAPAFTANTGRETYLTYQVDRPSYQLMLCLVLVFIPAYCLFHFLGKSTSWTIAQLDNKAANRSRR